MHQGKTGRERQKKKKRIIIKTNRNIVPDGHAEPMCLCDRFYVIFKQTCYLIHHTFVKSGQIRDEYKHSTYDVIGKDFN